MQNETQGCQQCGHMSFAPSHRRNQSENSYYNDITRALWHHKSLATHNLFKKLFSLTTKNILHLWGTTFDWWIPLTKGQWYGKRFQVGLMMDGEVCSEFWVMLPSSLWARFLSLAQSKCMLCSANHRAGYFSNLACDWLSTVWAYSKQETQNRPGLWKATTGFISSAG